MVEEVLHFDHSNIHTSFPLYKGEKYHTCTQKHDIILNLYEQEEFFQQFSSLFYWDYIKSMKLGFHPFLFFMSSVTRKKGTKKLRLEKNIFIIIKVKKKKKPRKFFHRWENLNFFPSLFIFFPNKRRTSIHYITYPYACGIHILSGMAISGLWLKH